MSTRHDLDPYPIPKEESPMYINEPWLIDGSLLGYADKVCKEPEDQEDILPGIIQKTSVELTQDDMIFTLQRQLEGLVAKETGLQRKL